MWWGHIAHDEVSDANVDRVQARVLDGMGFVALHSAHYSRPFRRLMGTSCALKWREANDRERLWVVAPDHPIADGLGEYFEIEREEMYGEFFDIPTPDTLVFVSWFTGGEVFRSGRGVRPRTRPDLLLPTGPRDVPDLPPGGGPAGDRQRRTMGGVRERAATDVRQSPATRWFLTL